MNAQLEKTSWQRHGPSSKPSQLQVDRELQNEGNKGWMPLERHKWPLLEPDNDLCIQEEQTHAEARCVSAKANASRDGSRAGQESIRPDLQLEEAIY